MDFANKVAWITGGTSGLGAATADLLIKRGAKVMITGRNEDRGKAVAAKYGDKALFVKGDVGTPEDNQAAYEKVLATWGRIDILLNSAGVPSLEGPILGQNGPADLNLFKNTINVNVFGTYDCMRLAAAAMSRNTPDEGGERGVIINVSSAFYKEIAPSLGSYGASKAAVHHLTKIAALDLGSHGIRVNAIAPGAFDTGLAPGGNSQALFDQSNAFPKRIGNPTEFAQLVETILQNGFINGTTIELDAGLRMGCWGMLGM